MDTDKMIQKFIEEENPSKEQIAVLKKNPCLIGDVIRFANRIMYEP